MIKREYKNGIFFSLETFLNKDDVESNGSHSILFVPDGDWTLINWNRLEQGLEMDYD